MSIDNCSSRLATCAMKAWLLDDFTCIRRRRLGQDPGPVPQPGEVVLELEYAALNPADRYLAEGQYPAKPSLPHILGSDGLGVVEQVRDGVSEFRVGDKAMLLRSETGVSRRGTFAERVAIPADSLVRLPAGWNDEEAGG